MDHARGRGRTARSDSASRPRSPPVSSAWDHGLTTRPSPVGAGAPASRSGLGGFAISFRISVRLRSIRWRRRADSQQLARLLLSEAHAEILIADAYRQHRLPRGDR